MKFYMIKKGSRWFRRGSYYVPEQEKGTAYTRRASAQTIATRDNAELVEFDTEIKEIAVIFKQFYDTTEIVEARVRREVAMAFCHEANLVEESKRRDHETESYDFVVVPVGDDHVKEAVRYHRAYFYPASGKVTYQKPFHSQDLVVPELEERGNRIIVTARSREALATKLNSLKATHEPAATAH